MSERTDEELIAAVCNGDEAAFNVLYARHYSSVKKYVANHYRELSAEDDDILQTTWMRVFKYAKTYDAGQGRVYTWIINITKMVILKVLQADDRRIKAHEAYKQQILSENPELACREPGAEETTINQEQRDLQTTLVQAAAMIAGPKDVNIISSLMEGKSQTEVARQFGISQQRVSQLCSRIKTRAKELQKNLAVV